MLREEYSPYKIVHHMNKIQKIKNGFDPGLLQVQIIPSGICNQKCTFCAYRMKDYLSNEMFDDKSMLSTDKVVETIDCLKDMDVKAIQYTGGGEPLVHPDIKKIFSYTLSNGLEYALVTNGQSIDDELSVIIGQCSWVRVSVDCSNSKTYSKIRGVPEKNFYKVIENIKKVVKNKNNNIIGIGYVVTKDNYKEIFEAAKMFKDIGVDNFRISAAFTPEGYKYFDGFLDEAKDMALMASSLSDENFTVFNLFNDRIKDNFDGVQDYKDCQIKKLQVFLASDYNVYTCCTLGYNKKGYIGSIKDMTFKEMWGSDQRIKFYNNHDASKICTFPCMYKGKNEFINYCIKKEAKHTNFI